MSIPSLPAEVRQRALALLREGKTPTEVAAATGAHAVTVRRWAAKAAIDPTPGVKGSPALPPRVQEQIARLAGGETPSQIAKDLEITPSAVRSVKRKHADIIAQMRRAATVVDK